MKFKKNNLLRFFMSDTNGRDCFYQFINEKMYWLIHLTRNLKMKTGTDSKIFFFKCTVNAAKICFMFKWKTFSLHTQNLLTPYNPAVVF